MSSDGVDLKSLKIDGGMVENKYFNQILADVLNLKILLPDNKEATAKAYVEKLYRFFVKSEWSSMDEINIINPLTQQMIDNDYEIMPIIRTLLSSQHFL